MAFDGLNHFIKELERESELVRIKTFVDPDLEITEITDRISKQGGKALLFENNGSQFPLLINSLGSEKRMSMAIGRVDLEDAGRELITLFKSLSGSGKGLGAKLRLLPSMFSMAALIPRRTKKRGRCQEVILTKPDLSILPVLKCWPFDGGKFITLPVVHTKHPETGEVNAGMYRMQIFDSNTTGMHWHRHKTGANHFEAWKKRGERMPVSVTLGGDPVYTYAATAPLPEGIDEYLLASYLRKSRVKLVKCLSNDLYVPDDADFVIEGYVDPAEELAWEGPFGDHTGFYSLADWYPRFHITAISHRRDAVYPATIVGIPPQEDTVIGKATERLFLYPIKLSIQPDIVDIHMPPAGVAHNLVLVKIAKSYPGQGLKVISALFGAGQMMFSKFIIVVDGSCDIFDYNRVMERVFKNVKSMDDLLITKGPLDVLDHSSDSFSFGGKMGLDASEKSPEETGNIRKLFNTCSDHGAIDQFVAKLPSKVYHRVEKAENRIALFISGDSVSDIKAILADKVSELGVTWIFIVDAGVDLDDTKILVWQILSNTDPVRDIDFLDGTLIIDSKAKNRAGFPRDWPNVVSSSKETISSVDAKWSALNLGPQIKSPSDRYNSLLFPGEAKANKD